MPKKGMKFLHDSCGGDTSREYCIDNVMGSKIKLLWYINEIPETAIYDTFLAEHFINNGSWILDIKDERKIKLDKIFGNGRTPNDTLRD